MAKIKIQGSSGTGTTTITSAVSNSDKTITLPDSTDTLAGQTQVNRLGGRKNLIINGGFDVWQRGTSFTPTVSNQVYTADRMGAYGADVVTLSRSTDVPNGTFKYSLKGVCDTVSTASNEFVLPLRLLLEGNSITSTGWGTTSGQDLSLSFYMKSNKVGTYGAQITNGTQTHSYYIEWSVTSSWQKFTFTIPKPPTSTWDLGGNTRGIDIQFGWGNGSNHKVGVADSTWSATNVHSTTNQVSFLDSASNDFHITGIQLELGDQATDFEHRSYGEELALCQRYYYSELAVNSGGTGGHTGVAINTARIAEGGTFPVTMRSAPDVNIHTVGTSETSGKVTLYNSSDNPLGSNYYASNPTIHGWRFIITSSSGGLTAGNFYSYKVTASAEL